MSLESRLLAALRPWRAAPRWYVALSGGLDSTVLLHLLASLARQQTLPPIAAIHVHHGLQAVAEEWPARCEALCQQLGVKLDVIRVEVASGPSLEQSARNARYAAIAALLQPSDVVFTAQHRDDQAETVLFRLLRGAGVRGMAGIPTSRALGPGTLVRPLLGFGRDELEAYAHAEGLDWIEDPSNACMDHSRNYLRHQIMPALTQRWPHAPINLARTAGHQAEAEALLTELAELDLAAAQPGHDRAWLQLPSLDLQALKRLSPARQRNALRLWLCSFTQLPDTDHWAGWEALRDAAEDRAPVWRLTAGELRRGEGCIWWLSGHWLQAPGGPVDWPTSTEELLLPGNGSVRVSGARGDAEMQIHYRQGGESLRLAGRGKRDLKRLLNETGLPGFVRARLPLLYLDGELTAVANLPHLDTQGVSLHWTPAADVRFELVGSFK